MMNTTPLFETLAKVTWRLLDLSQRNRVLMGEDAITSFNLNLLAASVTSWYSEDTRIDEANRGCDFELWIGDDAKGWTRYAIQAKKLTLSSGKYAGLSHSVGGCRQLDILNEYARANRAMAVYCFYNYSRENHGWSCGLPRETEQLGCSVAPASVVRQALATRGGRSFVWIHNNDDTIPWRCLTSCPKLLNRSASCGGQRWPSLDGYAHPRLPQALLSLRDGLELTSLYDASDLFDQEVAFRPARLAVVNLADDVGPRGPGRSEAWSEIASLLSPVLYSPKLDRAETKDILTPFKSKWGMNDEIFDLYVDSCMKSAYLLSESDFIATLGSLDTTDSRIIKSVILYLLQNLKR